MATAISAARNAWSCSSRPISSSPIRRSHCSGEYVAQLVKHKKKFLIIGNQNAITYKEIFGLLKENLIWLGVSIHSGDREFGVPDHYPTECLWNQESTATGNKFSRSQGNVRWFTNLDFAQAP